MVEKAHGAESERGQVLIRSTLYSEKIRKGIGHCFVHKHPEFC